MNHLAHFVVAASHPHLLAGALLGDHIKGRLTGERPATVEAGIQLHRQVDSFTDQHSLLRHSAQRFDPAFRRYAGIMLDIIFDYFLARRFADFQLGTLPEFNDYVFKSLADCQQWFDQPARDQYLRMRDRQSMLFYGDSAYIDRSLRYLATRLKHDNPLAGGYLEFVEHEQDLEQDFTQFFPELQAYTKAWIQQHFQELI